MLKQIFSVVMTLICMLSIMACQPSLSASTSGRVDAEDYDAFWIWGNISSAPYLAKAKELYILQGEFRLDRRTHQPQYLYQGVSMLNIPHQKVWLVFRNHHLNWSKNEFDIISKRIRQWENAGNHIQGIQIDFDAKTQNLHAYALFLAQLRQQLPAKYKLSITGLMDWSNMQDAKTLLLFRNNINEMIIQTYQGSTTIPNYEAYLHKISKLKLPYKIGVVQRGEWDTKLNFKEDPNFQGYVVFLLRNPSTP